MRAKLQLLWIAFLWSLLITDVISSSEDRLKRLRQARRHRTRESPLFPQEVMNLLGNDASNEMDKNSDDDSPDLRMDPCMDKHCGAGRVCKVTEEGGAECVCIETCDEERDPRRKVCTNYNETFGSDCEVYQARCFCDSGDDRCRGPDYQHVHIEYYGHCRQMPMCKEQDMLDFPRRMRDWLFNIMRDLADRQELPSHFLKMQREAETNMTLRWTNAAIWKWCDLDGHPHDRSVSRHELFPIRAPLMALEHCIAPFLDGCDVDNDHKITLKEWGKCLQLDEDDLEDKCGELTEAIHD
ncbi:SPARC [Chelonus insularis]|uniref:SPARC n=1 Tax=Chelonus insularis TaxID=460826 RepID=UPI00158DC7AE|nr:SPARC [Chelonus insularis]XP_034936804.1 SPARC [Chelonus insularis]XP_034936805.1 SPARC [Chelonus insularis]XP_034936806.1 SPARC [Chelonus insularis]